ncbi:MAG: exo-alpha-sialidase [Clostridiales bacterium]|nr:exo-alpha-sialidase [Clostridiales bacterium]
MYPTDPIYAESIRKFQGCPTLAITRGGRIYMGWYAGGTREPHMENYNLLIYSDDLGKNWSRPLLIIPSSKEKCVHALDIQLWTAPDGRLFVFWVQNNTHPAAPGEPGYQVDGYIFDDRVHAEWVMICDDPDAREPVFSVPRYLDQGFLRCKPTVLKNGAWINFNYDQSSPCYGYSISRDQGSTYTRHYGAQKIQTPFDETMAYEKMDGSIRMLARTSTGELAESTSLDGGLTWSKAHPSGIDNPCTRFFIARTPSGRILLINNDHREKRCNMSLYLSEDDGATWKYKRCIDTRDALSYPDADFYNGKIYLTYDRERTGAKEILFLEFTEEDVMDSSRPLSIRIISKP